ncbi:hypothetical protein ES703_45547 [subsurface metagenome]
MSFAVFDLLKKYAEWRERYLTAHPDKRLGQWLWGGAGRLVPDEPIIGLGEKGKKMVGIGVVAMIILLALGRSD